MTVEFVLYHNNNIIQVIAMSVIPGAKFLACRLQTVESQYLSLQLQQMALENFTNSL